MRPLSTYRLQMRGDSFTFADAENLLEYLDALGVSHLYLSPILTATRGSTHGYDVTDPLTVSAELGGAEGLARLSSAARARGMGADRGHRAQPRRGRRSAAEPVVAGCADARPEFALRILFRYRLGPGPAGPGRAAGPWCRWRRSTPGLSRRQHQLPGHRLAQRDLRLSAVLLHHFAGRAPAGGPCRLRCDAHGGQTLVRRGSRRRDPHRSPGRIIRPRRLSRVAA